MLKTPIVGKASLLHPQARMRLAGISVVFSTIAACTSGTSAPGGGTTDAPRGPPSEAGTTQLGILCSTFYSSSGTFVPNAADPPPANFTGCWPIGAWTFTLTLSTDTTMGGGIDTCTTGGHEPTALAKYQFTGTTTLDQDGDPVEHFTYKAQSNDPNVHTTIKVTEGGTGICQGGMSLFDTTGTKVWTLSPELNLDNSITGSAEYDLYGSNQWGG
jgi:hypothetical protein